MSKLVKCIFNGRVHEVEEGNISFSRVIELAGYKVNEQNPSEFSVTYQGDCNEFNGGELEFGKDIDISVGVVFDVTRTDKS